MTKNKKNLSRLIIPWFISYRSTTATNGMTTMMMIYVFLVLLFGVPYVGGQGNNEYTPGGSAYRFNANFNPSIAIIIIVLISAFFFMGFFAVYIRQCSGERRASGSVRPANGGTVGRSRRGTRGLDPAVIQTFPIFVYSDVKGLKIGKGVLECAVCLSEFEDDEMLRLLPKCDHVFHPECIDAWLVSHTTCPVCRANLKPESGETTTDGGVSATEVSDSENGSDNENHRSSEISEMENQVSIRVTENPQPETLNPTEIPIQNRPARSTRPRITGKYPRSHSTGHSLIQPGENCERFTLRLPDDVRKRIVNGKLNRTTSCLAFPTGDASVSGGSNRGGEGSSRGKNYKFGGWGLDRGTAAKSDRWVFSMAPPFFTRNSSVRSPKTIDGGDNNPTFPKASSRTSVKTPFDCLGAKAEECSEPPSSARPPV